VCRGLSVAPNDFGFLLRSTMPTRGVSCKANGADDKAGRVSSKSLLGATPVTLEVGLDSGSHLLDFTTP